MDTERDSRDDAYRTGEEAMLPPSLIDNLRAFVDDAFQLVRKEIDLAKAEFSEKLAQARMGLIFVFIGLLCAAVAMFLLMQSLVAWLATYFGTAGAALLVGTVVLIVAAIALAIGTSNLKARNLKPERTLRSTSENTRRLKESFHEKVQ
jgi:uncharacterized membrane protein YqjE